MTWRETTAGDPGNTLERTRPYWLGLHKLAEEEFVSGSDQIVRVDSEASATPTVNGWFDAIGGDTLEYVDDDDRGNVLHVAGDGFFGRGAFGIGDDSGNNNPNDVPLSTPNGVLQLWFKNDYTTISEALFAVTAENSSDDPITVRLWTSVGTDSSAGEQFDIYLGTDLNDGAWHFVEIDLRARIDDLVLLSSKLRAAYQVVPSAQIHAVLGTQSRRRGGGACSGVTAGYSRWWRHYNDLGAVLARRRRGPGGRDRIRGCFPFHPPLRGCRVGGLAPLAPEALDSPVVVPDRPWPSLPPPPPPRVPTRCVWGTAPIPTTRSCSTGSPAT